MSLKAELADQTRIGDIEWLFSKFSEVADQYKEFKDHTLAAETLSLWTQRFQKASFKYDARWDNNSTMTNILHKMDEVLNLMIDRWSSGDPSYLLAIRKSMQNLLTIRENMSPMVKNRDSIIPDLVNRAVAYARDEPRIAYGSLEAMGRSSPSNCERVRACLSQTFFHSAFTSLVNEESRSGMIGRCLVIILGTNAPPKSWFPFIKPYIQDFTQYQAIMTYFFEPLLKQSMDARDLFAGFYELCKPMRSLSVEIGILTAAKNAKLDVSQAIYDSAAIRESLSSISRPLRYDALNLLCGATRKLTVPIPAVVFETIISNAASLMAEGEPKSRADVYSAFRNLLIRVKTSKSEDEAKTFIQWISEWCSQSLIPGMPYRYMSMATRLLELFCQCGFKNEVLQDKVLEGLVNCVTSDFADIRESCVILLGQVQELPQVDLYFDDLVERAFKYIQGSRSGDAGARLLEFLNARRPELDLGSRVAALLDAHLSLAEENVIKASEGQSIHGYFIALRLVPPQTATLIPLILKTWKICSPPLMSVAPEGDVEEISNYCWKAIKESSLLVESTCTNSEGKGDVIKNDINTEVAETLLYEMARMLTEITHWGAFSAVPPAYLATAKIVPDAATSIVWNQLRELESRRKSRSVTRRSAGLPMLITSTLRARFDDSIVDALFKLAELPFSDGEVDELEMPQVHGMNCLRAVITDADITKSTSKFIEKCLHLSLSRFRSPSWSLRNCAAMLFSSLFKRLFGVRGLPVPASVFFQRFKRLRSLILDQLIAVNTSTGLPAVYPALAILAKLQTVSDTDTTLSAYWEPIVTLLGSPSWKIREMAARVVLSMTHESAVSDVVASFVSFLDPRNQNEMHGFALAVNELLSRPAAHGSQMDISSLSIEQKNGNSTLNTLEALIKQNNCMETSVELFKIWTKLGGRRRLIPVVELPKPKHLSPSIATFEAEQAVFDPSSLSTYTKGWSPVLKNLPSKSWTEDLAEKVLTDKSQLPDLQAMCIKTLQHASNFHRLGDIAISLLTPERPLSVRQEALVLAAKSTSLDGNKGSFEKWLTEIIEFSRDESPIESRAAATRGMQMYLQRRRDEPGFTPDDRLLYTLFTVLSDEEDAIRKLASITASAYLNLPNDMAAPECERRLIAKIDGELIAHHLADNLVHDCETARLNFENPEEPLFVIERESLFRDEIRNVKLQTQYCKPSPSETAIAIKAKNTLEGLDFTTPLQAGASYDLAVIRARINALV